MSELALDVAGQPEPADMISRVAESAAKLIDCAAADLIRVAGAGRLRIVASSDPALSAHTEQAWRRWPHTPMSAARSADGTEMVLQRSSYLQQLRAATGIVQELIAPLRAGEVDHGYLRFLFSEPLAGSTNGALISAFCAHAVIALDRAALLTQVHSLRVALDSNRDISAAVGVLMARGNLTYAQGLHHLKEASAHANRKLRDIAAEVLLIGQLPRVGDSE